MGKDKARAFVVWCHYHDNNLEARLCRDGFDLMNVMQSINNMRGEIVSMYTITPEGATGPTRLEVDGFRINLVSGDPE